MFIFGIMGIVFVSFLIIVFNYNDSVIYKIVCVVMFGIVYSIEKNDVMFVYIMYNWKIDWFVLKFKWVKDMFEK